MKNKMNYTIAGQDIEIITDYPQSIARLLPGFAPFQNPSPTKEPMLELSRVFEQEELDLLWNNSDNKIIHTFDLENDLCTLSKNGNNYYFTIAQRDGGVLIEFAMELGSSKVKYRLKSDSHFKFSLWMALGFTGIPKLICAVHSSVIIYNNSAVLFLGESGTGKSTHTKLWLEHIAGSTLLNDDSPILSIDQEKPIVHGSPWSGKGQKYVNECYPIKAVVRIIQHPSNKLQKLNTLESFAALYPSFPPAYLKDNYFQDHICEIISKVICSTPIYHLYCLPNRQAAQLVMETIYK